MIKAVEVIDLKSKLLSLHLRKGTKNYETSNLKCSR